MLNTDSSKENVSRETFECFQIIDNKLKILTQMKKELVQERDTLIRFEKELSRRRSFQTFQATLTEYEYRQEQTKCKEELVQNKKQIGTIEDSIKELLLLKSKINEIIEHLTFNQGVKETDCINDIQRYLTLCGKDDHRFRLEMEHYVSRET